MLLKELLSITAMDEIIILKGINSKRIKRDILKVHAVNNMGIIEGWAWDEIIKEYGLKKVLCQNIKNGKLEILIKE